MKPRSLTVNRGESQSPAAKPINGPASLAIFALTAAPLEPEARLLGGEEPEARGTRGAGELHRSQHRARSGLIDENALVAIPVVPGGRRPPDPAGIEDLVRVAAIGSAELDAKRRLEQIEAFG